MTGPGVRVFAVGLTYQQLLMYNPPMTPAPSRARVVSGLTAADAFQALSDETRLAVLEMLRDGERCVCDLQAALDAAQSRLSFHLKVLKDAGLVTDRKEGRWSYYALNAERFAELEAIVGAFAQAPSAAAPSLHSLTRSGRRPAAGATASSSQRAASKRDNSCC